MLIHRVLFYKNFELMIEDKGANQNFFKTSVQSMEKVEFLCFNPGCTVLGVGCFHQSEISLHNNCTGWIIKMSDIDKIMYSSASNQTDSNTQNTFDFKY